MNTQIPAPKVENNAMLLQSYAEDRKKQMEDAGVTDELEMDSAMRVFSYPKINTREGILVVSDFIESRDNALGEDPFPLFHTFGGGSYTREIHLPRGYYIVGKIHKKESMVYVLKGKILVTDENDTKVIEAPAQFISSPWVKRIAYILEDTIWIDIHGTDCTTIEDAENELFTCHYDDETGYEEAIKELGLSEEEVRQLSEITEDMIEMPEEYKNNVEVRDSEIEGKGMFATKQYVKNDIVGIARVNTNRTPLGRYTNHSDYPNVVSKIINNELHFIARKNISKDREITVDYREVRSSAIDMDNQLSNEVIK